MRYSLKFYEIYLVFIAVCLLNLPQAKRMPRRSKRIGLGSLLIMLK